MRNLSKYLPLAALGIALASGAAEAATVTVTNNFIVSDTTGKNQVIGQTATVAAFTVAQNIAQVTITEGLWQCQGQLSIGTVTNASVINLGISKTTGALPVAGTDGKAAFASLVTMTTQANATAGFPQLTTAPAWFYNQSSTPVTIFLVASMTVSSTGTESLSCWQVGSFI